ncbi:MAG: ATP synthase F0 subunit B [Thermodesulfovibrionales bacterium]
MLNFEPQWFVVLLANFLVLLFILNKILFKPLLEVAKEREKATKGSLDEAHEMMLRKDEAAARMQAELLASKNKAKSAFESLRDEGQSRQKETLSKTEAQAVEMIEKARKELQGEAEKARRSLKAEIDRFSEEIVRKLVKA